MVEQWLEEPEEVDFDRETLRRETYQRIEEWNALGRELCAGFLGAVERLRLAA
jgi:hypothetical protein